MKPENFQQEFNNALFKTYPDVQSSGQVTRKQIIDIREQLNTNKWPTHIVNNQIGRGLYAISGGVPADEMLVIGAQTSTGKSMLNSPEVRSLIPVKDRNYVAFGNHKDVDQIVKSGLFYPTYITGPTGNGKSTMVEQVCASNKKALIRVNLNMMTDEEQLIGSKTLVDGNVEIVEGPVLIAMRAGATLLLDEIDAGGANALLCLQPILEGKPFYFKLKNELITPAKGFNVFATANTKGKGSDDGRYIGTNILNEAFLERFAVTLNQDYPSASVEKKIVLNLMQEFSCVNEDYAETLVKWADAIRRTFEDGGIDELITTRRLAHVVRAYSIFKDTQKSVELCCNRFDDVTRTAFIDLFNKIATEPVTTQLAATPVRPKKSNETPF
jgi:hypothetical protein